MEKREGRDGERVEEREGRREGRRERKSVQSWAYIQ